MKLIAETAWNHDGNFGFLVNLVKNIILKTKTDYIKFHISLDVDEYMTPDHPGYKWMKKNIFSEHQWDIIFNLVLKNNKKLVLLFNDSKAIDFGMDYNPDIIEIHSVCLNDVKLLAHLNDQLNDNTKVILGTGGSDIYEIENSIEFIKTKNIILMHGFQNYPTNYENINLSRINKIIRLFPQYEHGYADHTSWNDKHNILITLLGAAKGVGYIEKHVTTAYGEKRTDWEAAISITMFNELYDNLALLKKANGNGLLTLNNNERCYSRYGLMKKTAILNKNVAKGEILELEVIDFKRTNQTSDMSQLDIINSLGKPFLKDLKVGHCILSNDIEK